MYISRKILLQILQCGFQLLCQFNSPGLGLFGNGQQYGRFSSLRSSTQFGFLRTNLHIGNILQCNGHPFHRLDDGTWQLIHIMTGKHPANNIFVSIFINHSAIGILIHVTGNVHHLCQRNIVMFHAGRVKQHLIFLDITSQHGNLCHTSRREQARTDSPVCQCTEIEHGSSIRSQTDNQQLT